MFKKRTRPTAVRDKPAPEGPLEEKVASGSNSEPEEEEYACPHLTSIRSSSSQLRSNIDELILLRKLRRSQPGINLEKLNRGEERRKGRKRDVFDGAAENFGLQTQRNKDGDKDE